jgi:hypothetical protein
MKPLQEFSGASRSDKTTGISRQGLPTFLAKYLPYAAIVVIGLAAGGATLMFNFRTAMAALIIIGLPVILAAIVCIINYFRRKRETVPTGKIGLSLSSRHFGYLVLVSAILYILSLCFLFQGGPRPLYYFCLITVIVALISLEIFGTENTHHARQMIIIAQITLLVLNFIYGQTLNLPLFFGGGDLLRHMGWIDTILETGHITSAIGGYYQWFPLFHVFGAEGVLVTGMSLQTSYFILFGFIFTFSVFIVYLLVKSITKDVRLALLATLIYATMREPIFNGMYMNTRELACIFYLAILYLLLQTNWRLRAIALFLIIPMVPLHHTTLVHFSMILAAIFVIEMILYGRSKLIGYNYLALLTMAYVGYWLLFCYPFFHDMVLRVAPSDVLAVPTGGGIAASNLINTALRNVDYIILGFIMFIGVINQLQQDKQEVTTRHVFAVFGLLAFVVFMPDIASILSPLLLAYRLALLVSPIISFVFAAGLLALIPRQGQYGTGKIKSAVSLSLITVVIMIFSFSSQYQMSGATDVNLSNLGSTSPRRYFSEAELASFALLAEYQGDIPIYTDEHTGWYFEAKYNQIVDYSTDTLVIGQTRGNAYLLLRETALTSRGQLIFDVRGQSAMHHEEYVYRNGQEPNLKELWQNERCIYNDGEVQIYLK